MRKLSWRFWVLGSGALLTLLLLSVTTYLTMFMVRPRMVHGIETPEQWGLTRYERLETRSPDGINLVYQLFPSNVAEGRTVLLIHGVGSNRTRVFKRAARLHEWGYQVATMDLRGHGESGGRFTTYGVQERHDVGAVVQALVARADVRDDGVVLIGYSMGAAVALQSMVHPKVRAVIADSPFADLPSMMRFRGKQWGVPEWPFLPITALQTRLIAGFDPAEASALEVARSTRQPILVFHGEADTVIPVEQSRTLKEAVPRIDLWTVPGADHVGCSKLQPDEYNRRMSAFLTTHLPR